MLKQLTLTIGWLYPDLMSTYGDRGNIICLSRRCQWRNISVKILSIEIGINKEDVKTCNLIIGGGAQDRQQEIVAKDLKKNKKEILKNMFLRGIPGLFVCGSPQLLGHYYMTGDGTRLEGLGIFDFETRHFGHNKPRCIGNTAGKIIFNFQFSIFNKRKTIVGFENHGGRTYLGKNCQLFAKVLSGYGNNGEDGYEGAVYKNVIACYYHGPFLPKNPHIADWLIGKALEVKYNKDIKLKPLDDTLEWQAHEFMLKRLRVHS
ncbi:cobalamin biosynthesis protein CobQ [Candidatus Gottesmanbacteria bacterium]|nr:cobalamin biosynthesis protein CobQ [Candidatus Gottesmanbacteria bacterium]